MNNASNKTPVPPFEQGKVSRPRFPHVLKWVYAVLIAMTAANFSYVAYSLALNGQEDPLPLNQTKESTLETDLQPPAGPALKPLSHYEELADRRNIFQFDLQKFAAAAPAEPAEAAQTAATAEIRKLSVAGIVLDGTPQAVLKDPATRESFFLEVGGEVRGAKVREIREDSVILDLQGQTITLKLGGSSS